MVLPHFEILVPENVEQACSMLQEYQEEGVRLLAGGTDLLVDLKRPIIPEHVPRCDGCSTHPNGEGASTVDSGLRSPDPLMQPGGSLRSTLEEPGIKSPAFLVSLHRIDHLKRIETAEDGSLRIGALATIAEIQRNRMIRTKWTALSEGADSLGSPLVRNRGTIGGNIANARPAADTAVPTIALGGELVLQGVDGMRRVPASGFPVAPGKTVIRSGEVLTEVIYPPQPSYSGSAYCKLANRKALEISVVGVAVWLELDGSNGIVKDIRITLGAVGPTPIAANSAREAIIGRVPDERAIEEAAEAAMNDCRPIDDHRGSAWYRIRMVKALTRRMIQHALLRAGGDE